MTATARLAALRERFGPLLDEVREGAVRRELASTTAGRELPRDLVRRLAGAGLGRVRLPVADGGDGVDLVELGHLVADLAAADSNVAHLFRGHFGFTELVLLRPASGDRQAWISRLAGGAVVGNATSERTGADLADISTTLRDAGDGSALLDGTKYYSTGTSYSDWVYLAAGRARADGPAERVTLAVPTDAPGVTVLDDWDGFGQRLTASGTTRFEGVRVDPAAVSAYRDAPRSHIQAFYQWYLLAVLAGIAEAAERDVVEFVRPRTRSYVHANAARPADDPQVLAVVGEVSSGAFAARALVAEAARRLDAVVGSSVPGEGVDRDLLDDAEHAVYQAQVELVPRVLRATTELFEVGGASATDRGRALDRHWRNARVVASHNPVAFKQRLVGERALHGRGPSTAWSAYHDVGPTRAL